MVSAARTTATIPARRAPTTTTGTSVGRAAQTSSPVLLLMVARVLWTARPPARPALGAEATMSAPAGPVTFRCPLAVRSTRPPARCTAAAIGLASLERQRFGAACFFSAMPADPQHPRTRPFPHRGQRPLHAQAPGHRATPAGTPSCSGRPLTSRFGVRAAPVYARGHGRGRHAPTMPPSEGGTDGGQRRSHRSCPGAGQICHTGYGAAEDRPGGRPQAGRRGRRAAAGRGHGQPAGPGGRARPGTIAGGLAGREAPACLGWPRGNHSAGDGGEAR